MRTKLKPFRYADETFYPLKRIVRGKWAGYLLCLVGFLERYPSLHLIRKRLAYSREDS